MFWWLDKRLRGLRKRPRYSVAELPEVTIGRIVGVARAIDGRTIEAPISGRPCLAHFVFATSSGPGGYGDSDPITLAEESNGIPFEVVDASGAAIVDPDGATCALEKDHRSWQFSGRESDPRHRAFLERIGVAGRSYAGIQCREGIVSLGEKIAVIGFGQRTGGRLRMSSSPHFPLVICDNPAVAKSR